MSDATERMLAVEHFCPLITVFDMATSLRFYRDLLGFQMIQSSEPGDDCGWCWISLGPVNLMLNSAYETEERPSAPDPARIASHTDTGLYFGADPDRVYDYFRSRGLAVEPPRVAPYGMKQLYLHDPDRYALCFHSLT